MARAQVEELLDALRRSGDRITPARRAVVEALVAASDHVTADDVAAAVERSNPDVHRSTIYRTLEALERSGIVDHVHLGHGRAVYHLASDPHHHLVCDVCGFVVEVPDELFEGLGAQLAERYGFTLRTKHFAVLGRCAECGPLTPS